LVKIRQAISFGISIAAAGAGARPSNHQLFVQRREQVLGPDRVRHSH